MLWTKHRVNLYLCMRKLSKHARSVNTYTRLLRLVRRASERALPSVPWLADALGDRCCRRRFSGILGFCQRCGSRDRPLPADQVSGEHRQSRYQELSRASGVLRHINIYRCRNDAFSTVHSRLRGAYRQGGGRCRQFEGG